MRSSECVLTTSQRHHAPPACTCSCTLSPATAGTRQANELRQQQQQDVAEVVDAAVYDSKSAQRVLVGRASCDSNSNRSGGGSMLVGGSDIVDPSLPGGVQMTFSQSRGQGEEGLIRRASEPTEVTGDQQAKHRSACM
eukprot:m.213622 g.213622  ORF g.213622 m.213622 type:complete len:138 (-) comp15577_c0_seq23:231-644(-)